MPSPSEVPDEVIYVGFWARVGAALIDTIVVSIILEILFSVLGLDVDTGDTVPTDLVSMQAYLLDPRLWAQLVLSLVLPLVAIIILWRRLKATPGKMAIGAEVVDARTLGPLSTGQSVVRGLGYFASMIPFCLGLIWVGIDARKQGWHDKLAGTVVIKKKPRKP